MGSTPRRSHRAFSPRRSPIIRGRDTVVAASVRTRVEVMGVVFALGVVGLLALPVPAGAGSAVTASEVSVGSPHNIAPRSHQNEPVVAMDAHQPRSEERRVGE